MLGLLIAGVALTVGAGGLAVAAGRARRGSVDARTLMTPEQLTALMAVQIQGYMREKSACSSAGLSTCERADRLLTTVSETARMLGLIQFAAALAKGGHDKDMAVVTELWPGTAIPILQYIQDNLGIR